MNAMTVSEMTLSQEVFEFLSRNSADAEFRTVCELVQRIFPEHRGIEAKIRDDPDEDGRQCVVIFVLLRASYPYDMLNTQLFRYHERLVTEIPLAKCPLFVLLHDFVPE